MDGELREDLAAAGVEVLVRPLAVMRRASMSPGGLVRDRRRAGRATRAGWRGCAARAAWRSIHTNTSVTLGGSAASRVARIPHVWHLREIYTGFERFWPAYRRLLLTARRCRACRRRRAAQLGDAPQACVLHDGLPLVPARAERDAARAALGAAARTRSSWRSSGGSRRGRARTC